MPKTEDFPFFVDFAKQFPLAGPRSIERAREYLENMLKIRAKIDGQKVRVSKRVTKQKETRLRGFMDGLMWVGYDSD